MDRIQDGIDNWNDSGAGVNISMTNGSSIYKITVDNITEIYDPEMNSYTLGVNDISLNDGIITNSLITIYNKNIVDCHSNGIYNLDNVRISVIVHEIGHTFGLDDNPIGYDDNSIMSYSRDDEVITGPQVIDVYNVKYQYDYQ